MMVTRPMEVEVPSCSRLERYDWPGSWTANLPDVGEFVAVISAHDFSEPDLIRDVIQGAPGRDITFVVRQRDQLAIAAFEALDIEPVVATLNPIWKSAHPEYGYDNRNTVRDSEILNRCTRVIIFKTPQTKTLDAFSKPHWAHKVRVLERGAKSVKKHRKGRVIT